MRNPVDLARQTRSKNIIYISKPGETLKTIILNYYGQQATNTPAYQTLLSHILATNANQAILKNANSSNSPLPPHTWVTLPTFYENCISYPTPSKTWQRICQGFQRLPTASRYKFHHLLQHYNAQQIANLHTVSQQVMTLLEFATLPVTPSLSAGSAAATYYEKSLKRSLNIHKAMTNYDYTFAPHNISLKTTEIGRTIFYDTKSERASGIHLPFWVKPLNKASPNSMTSITLNNIQALDKLITRIHWVNQGTVTLQLSLMAYDIYETYQAKGDWQLQASLDAIEFVLCSLIGSCVIEVGVALELPLILVTLSAVALSMLAEMGFEHVAEKFKRFFKKM